MSATVTVENVRQWIGKQRRGAVSVRLDGKKIGLVFPEQKRSYPCPQGRHSVRVRQWWYFSARLDVELQPGEEILLVADRPRGNILVAMAVLMFRPWRSISLERKTSATA